MRLKKGALFLSIILLGGWFFPDCIWAEGVTPKGGGTSLAKVTFIQGKAEALTKGETAWRLLKLNSFLYPEDEVRTKAKSRIEIQLPDGSILRFDEETTFKIKKSFFEASTNRRDIKVEMFLGKTWANVRKFLGAKKTFEIASANAVAGVRDTIWRMNVEKDKSTLIKVYEGVVQVYNPFLPEYKPEKEGYKPPHEVPGPKEVPPPYHEVSKEEWEEIVLREMMQVRISGFGKPSAPSRFNLEEDRREEWVRWNQKRDRALKSKK